MRRDSLALVRRADKMLRHFGEPALAPEEHAEVQLQIKHFELPNGMGLTVAVTKGAATSV